MTITNKLSFILQGEMQNYASMQSVLINIRQMKRDYDHAASALDCYIVNWLTLERNADSRLESNDTWSNYLLFWSDIRNDV